MKRPRHADLCRGLLWIIPWIIGFAVFMLLPMIMSFYYSLTDYPIIEAPVFIGLDNYRELLSDSLFWITIRNTAIYAVVAVPLGTMIALALAVLLNQQAPGMTLARAAVFLPTLIPIVAASLGWMWLYNGEFGLVNTALDAIGIQGPNWLSDSRWAMASLIIMSFWNVGSAMIIFLAALQDVPRPLIDAASIDGATAWRRFHHVTLPTISPAILFNVTIGIIWALQVFAVPHIMTEGGPDNATNFYTMHLYQNAFLFQRMGYASAMAWIQLLAILILTAGVFALARRMPGAGTTP